MFSNDPVLVMSFLGYRQQVSYPEPEYSQILDLPSAINTQIDSTIAELHQLDAQIVAARADSMAVTVDKLEVNYVQHLSILYGEASRLLQLLSNLLGIPIVYNKYTGQAQTQRRSRYMIKSYS